MTTAKASKLEAWVEALEADVACLKTEVKRGQKPAVDWLDKIWGSFANDPMYEEAMRLGREYRESQGPKPRKQRKN
jgi:hypothetical protein